MAASFKGAQYVVTGTAATLTAAMGLTAPIFLQQVIFRAGTGAGGITSLGPAGVTTSANQYAVLSADESVTFGPYTGYLSSDVIYIIGSTPGDILHIAVVS